jgi:hypothetical protein
VGTAVLLATAHFSITNVSVPAASADDEHRWIESAGFCSKAVPRPSNWFATRSVDSLVVCHTTIPERHFDQVSSGGTSVLGEALRAQKPGALGLVDGVYCADILHRAHDHLRRTTSLSPGRMVSDDVVSGFDLGLVPVVPGIQS